MLIIKLKVAIQKANLHTQTVKELVTSEGSINAPFVNILCANTVTLGTYQPTTIHCCIEGILGALLSALGATTQLRSYPLRSLFDSGSYSSSLPIIAVAKKSSLSNRRVLGPSCFTVSVF